jgi:hypothetical protein
MTSIRDTLSALGYDLLSFTTLSLDPNPVPPNCPGGSCDKGCTNGCSSCSPGCNSGTY